MNALTICKAAAIAYPTAHGGVRSWKLLEQLRALKVGRGESAFICILVHGGDTIVDERSVKTDGEIVEGLIQGDPLVGPF